MLSLSAGLGHNRAAATVRAKTAAGPTAVEGAVRERWSNGPVEGHINRLKMLRRRIGRAGVEFLRARVLPISLTAV